MNLAQALTSYLTLNFLILVSATGMAIFLRVLKMAKIQILAKSLLNLNYFLFSAVLLMTGLQPALPKQQAFEPIAKIWVADSGAHFSEQYTPGGSGFLSMGNTSRAPAIVADHLSLGWAILSGLILVLALFRLFRDLRFLRHLSTHSFHFKKIGSVEILLSDEIKVPFSYWIFGKNRVVIPTPMLAQKDYFKVAVTHELQHHRKGDARWVYLVWVLRLVCVGNPAVHIWGRWISEFQEFACDEALVDQHKVESQVYARCLFEVAKTALEQKRVPVGATGLTFLSEGNLIKRRIQNMFENKRHEWSRSISLLCASLLLLMMGGATYASKTLVQDRRITQSQADDMLAQWMSENPKSAVDFPVVVNDLVLRELNHYLGTPEKRESIKLALQRLETQRTMIKGKLQEYGLPLEWMAIPIVESGCQNLPQSVIHPEHGAGWWMFISSTAKHYGLKVDSKVDERLDIEKETIAAMKYLSLNRLRFNDLRLAVMAYEMGEDHLQKIMDRTHSRDPWVLVRNSGGDHYLAQIMAAVLILKNPSIVQ